MNIEEIRDYCLAKPYTTEAFPFGEEHIVFRVGDTAQQNKGKYSPYAPWNAPTIFYSNATLSARWSCETVIRRRSNRDGT